MLSLRQISRSTPPVSAIANTAPGGLVSLTNSTLRRGSEGAEAVANNGTIVAHGVTLDGFAAPEGATLPLQGVWQGQRWQPKQSRLDLTLADAPPPPSDPVDRWVNVLHYAASG